MMQLSNFLLFTTNCEEALAFQAECDLGPVAEVLCHGDNGMPASNEAMCGKIVQARFEGPGVLFYASDNDDAEPMRGSAHILMVRYREQTRRLFELMARGERVTTALSIQPWGDFYGKHTNRRWARGRRAAFRIHAS